MRAKRGSRRELRLRKRNRKRRRGLLQYALVLLVTAALVFGVVRPFLLKAFWIPSESMTPTFEVGDYLFVNKLAYRLSEPERGDIVVFDGVEGDDELIKRVAALPGDRVTVRAGGRLFVNGEEQDEPYLDDGVGNAGIFRPERVPEGHVFVMGDNRDASRDSRFFGPVPYENIEGEAFVTFWPPTRVGLP